MHDFMTMKPMQLFVVYRSRTTDVLQQWNKVYTYQKEAQIRRQEAT